LVYTLIQNSLNIGGRWGKTDKKVFELLSSISVISVLVNGKKIVSDFVKSFNGTRQLKRNSLQAIKF
jgi:hypothetical protein